MSHESYCCVLICYQVSQHQYRQVMDVVTFRNPAKDGKAIAKCKERAELLKKAFKATEEPLHTSGETIRKLLGIDGRSIAWVKPFHVKGLEEIK